MKLLINVLLLPLLFLSPGHVLSEPMTRQQAVDIAQQQFPGRVLSVKRTGETIRVKILNPKGEVRIIKVKDQDNQPKRSSR